ncbi:MAG: hypothetical protein ACHQFZ_04545 [Acidimicrobiales bacterium]
MEEGTQTVPRPVKVWTTPRLTGSDLIGSLLIMAGPVVIAFAMSQVFAQPDVFAFGIIIGVVWIAEGLMLTLGPARRLEAFDDGSINLIKRRRTLHIPPGELRTVRPFVITDWWRAAPMRVRAVSGAILYKPPPGEQDDVWILLGRTNPEAKLSSPHGWFTKRRGP